LSYPKNAATPPRIAVGAVVQISDGAVQTSGVSIRVVPQGGSAAAGLGTTSYEDGVVLYAPTQAETNYEAFAVIAYKTGCIPAATTVVTSASATAGYSGVDWSKVTSATSTVNLSGTTIKTATDVETDTQDIQSRLPTALVSGRMDASVGAAASNSITAASLAADASSEIASAVRTELATELGRIDASVSSRSSHTASDVWLVGTRTLTAFSFSVTVGTIGNNVITAATLAADAGAEIASAVRSELATELARIDAATSSRSSHSASDVWSVATRTLTAFSFSVTVGTNNDKTGYSLATAPLDASGTAAAVWGALLASYTTADTFGARVVRSTNSNNSVAITGANHVAADIHELQPAVIQATHFDLGAIDANALAADAAAEIAAAVWSAATRTLTAFSFAITVDAASIRSAIGMASANLDTQLDAIPTAAEIDTQLTASHGAGSWAVGGTGSGAFTLTLTVNDGTSPLENATVRMVEGVNAYVGQTNASGVVAFSLDAATYSVAITKDGYSFTPTTKVVSATGSQTYSMTQITPTIPAAAGLSTGTAVCYGTTGLPIAGVVVTIQQIDGKGVAGSAYDGDTFTLTSNAQGVISHNGFVRGAVYSIRRGIRGEVKSFVVPDAASFDLSEIVGRD
jgi:hypothetical protein